ncbi:hypothetical protein TrLO_g14355 [Triparma laevis f. longispina]|uniref:Chlorophyll a-b binding protein, chloroplastic n=1 Tax=Triparma laevis f. longispina TaxID=1714387 RepID=A0A9W7DZN6_9STRA|nr:hypothetical protein TrLO_g14355 [Triparma laevis f. longispina]
MIEIPLSDYTDLLDDLLEPTLEDLQNTQTSLSPLHPEDRLKNILNSATPPIESIPGTGGLPGDCNFDPLNFHKFDPYLLLHRNRLRLTSGSTPIKTRPKNLIMRDYRASEIRHGRLCMLVSILWPAQELLNNLILPSDYTFSILGGGLTLPWIPLFMCGCMMGLGYLDVYANVIQSETTGEAYQGGDCFWDPIKILQGCTPEQERQMLKREVWNGRFSMIAVLGYIVQEAVTGRAVVDLEWNELFFYTVFAAKDVMEEVDILF